MMLSGCHLVPSDRTSVDSSASAMPLWHRYQQCRSTTDHEDLLALIREFEAVMPVGSEPPDWMKAWGKHVTRQPLRATVDPQALAVACTLRTAAVMAARDRPDEARRLYDHILTHYGGHQWAYYRERARTSLAGLSPAVVRASSPSRRDAGR